MTQREYIKIPGLECVFDREPAVVIAHIPVDEEGFSINPPLCHNCGQKSNGQILSEIGIVN